MWEALKAFLNAFKWPEFSPDPVKECPVYLDKENGSCAHVDGFLCDFPDCSMIKDYRAQKNNQVSELVRHPHPPSK